jgi:hypothetical protein
MTKLRIQSADRDSAILVCDEDYNDIAEFYHNEHATVSQSYETALDLAQKLVASPSRDEIVEECAKAIYPKQPRPCDCDRCDCYNQGDAEAVARWDSDAAAAKTIRALKGLPNG